MPKGVIPIWVKEKEIEAHATVRRTASAAGPPLPALAGDRRAPMAIATLCDSRPSGPRRRDRSGARLPLPL